ncbi:hypothetical protein BGZ76_008989 [Entomortierella beljakovae]|nr:hypothetical protein BGZ76_008989 [Entomortierella beljakovae]
MSSSNSQLKIAIVGAGLGGLALARTLQQNDINCTVFELDESPSSRSQGGTLDMHPESGQSALRTNDLWEKILPHIRYEGEDMRMVDKTGKTWMENVADLNDLERETRPEVDRGVLRQVYLDSLNEGTIHWGTRVKRITPVESESANGQALYVLALDDGRAETFNLVVGADGVWSRVRSFLSDAKPIYSGLTMIETRIANADNDHPEESKLVGRGSIYALSDSKGLVAQRNGDGSIRTYICLQIPENSLPENQLADESAAKENLLDNYFEDWTQDLKNLVVNSEGLITRVIYVLPIQYRWTSRPGVTVIGDAAHLMSPFAGAGANLAMIDGVDLGLTIAKNVNENKNLALCQQEFENAMLDRSQAAAQIAASNLATFINPDAPRSTVLHLQQFLASKASPSDITPSAYAKITQN